MPGLQSVCVACPILPRLLGLPDLLGLHVLYVLHGMQRLYDITVSSPVWPGLPWSGLACHAGLLHVCLAGLN